MHRFSKTAPASFGQFWQFLKTVAENLAGASKMVHQIGPLVPDSESLRLALVLDNSHP